MDKELPDNVARLVDLDLLARKGPLKVWAGRGKGGVCVLCLQPIAPTQSEDEVEFTLGAPTLEMHVDCFLKWRQGRLAPAD